MMLLDTVNNLPETTDSNTINDLLRKVLSDKTMSFDDKIECMVILSEKQWHNYELLDAVIKDRIEEWFIDNTSQLSRANVDSVISVVAYLGLQKVYNSLLHTKFHDESINHVIQEAKSELGDSVANPYEE